MYGAAVATYINQNMIAHNLSAKEVAAKSQTPESTLSNYRTGKVEKPNEEQLFRIAAVWGDSPDTIRLLRFEAEEAMRKEARLKDEAKDRELINQIADVIKSGSIALLDQHADRMAAQQSEILQHADARVEEERRRAADLNARVLKQCQDEVARIKESCAHEIAMNKEFCDERIRLTEKHYEARLADQHAHLDRMMDSEHLHGAELRERYGSSREYLKSSVRNLTGACALLGLTNIFFGSYAIFAYTTFDMNDLTRGLHRENYSMGPVMLALLVSMIAIAASRLVILFLNRPKKKEKVEG